MALSSQTLNNGVRSQFMASRRRRRKRPGRWLLGVALLLLAAFTVWWVWPDGEVRPPAGAANDPLVAAVPATIPPDRGSPTRATRPEATPDRTLSPPARDANPTPAGTAAFEARTDVVPSEVAVASATRPAEWAAREVEAPPKADPAPAAAAAPLLSATESIPARDPAAAPPNRDEVATLSALADRDPIRVRAELTELVVSGTLTPSQERHARETLNRINGRLLFSPHVQQDDPFVRVYSVQPGDSLERIVRRELAGGPDWRFIQRINGIRNPRGLQINQRLKLPVGSFHAVVDKSEFRMDLFLVDGGRRILVASYPVGLGELNSTPEGVAKVRKGSKLIDPEWYNPRTSEYFAANDPENPIGEHWIGLSSVESGDRLFDGYGIHGTVEPDSIGRSESMGCVRMLPEHVAVVYEMLTEPDSTVEVRP